MRQTLLHGAHITAQTLDPSPEKDRHVSARHGTRYRASRPSDVEHRRDRSSQPDSELVNRQRRTAILSGASRRSLAGGWRPTILRWPRGSSCISILAGASATGLCWKG